MEEVNITIIGAGVVGLAIAASLSEKYRDIVVLDKHTSFGQETSSRNSEVIHAGIYYPENSLKAKLCVEGAEKLYDICKTHSIPHKRIGKLIIATEDSELKALEGLLVKGRKNGVKGLKMVDKKEAAAIEPNTNAIAALYSPDTGIIDSHALMNHFYTKAQGRGVLFSFNSEVNLLEKLNSGFIVGVRQEDFKIKSGIVINSAGLSSDYIAGLAEMDIKKEGYSIKFCKGSYFSYARKSPVSLLVYPVPHDELVGLGVHATLDLGGRLRFGPDAEYVGEIDYKVDKIKSAAFFKGAQKIIRGLEEEYFMPDMAGIRPKLSGPGEKARDFVIKEESDRGLAGLINLIGIESPGLTSCAAIAKMVRDYVDTIQN